MENKPQFIVVHHSASLRDSTDHKMIDRWHREKGFPLSQLGYYVGYHYVIMGNGLVKQTRMDNEGGAHAKTDDGMNFKSIGICLTGNFEVEQPSKEQIDSLERLIANLQFKFNSSLKIIGHRDVCATVCPGENLYQWLVSPKEKIKYQTKNDNAFVILVIADDTLDKNEVKNYCYEAQVGINKNTESMLTLDICTVYNTMSVWDNGAIKKFIDSCVDKSCFQAYVSLYRQDKYRQYLAEVSKSEFPVFIVQSFRSNPGDPTETAGDVLVHELMAHAFPLYLNKTIGTNFDLYRGDSESPTEFQDDWSLIKPYVKDLYFKKSESVDSSELIIEKPTQTVIISSMNKEQIKKRLWSLLWRIGMMVVIVIVDWLGKNIGIFNLSASVVVVIGLILGEISKYLNQKKSPVDAELTGTSLT